MWPSRSLHCSYREPRRPAQESPGVPDVPEAAGVASATGADDELFGAADRGGLSSNQGHQYDSGRTCRAVADPCRAGGRLATVARAEDQSWRSGKTQLAAGRGCALGCQRVKGCPWSHARRDFTDELERNPSGGEPASQYQLRYSWIDTPIQTGFCHDNSRHLNSNADATGACFMRPVPGPHPTWISPGGL